MLNHRSIIPAGTLASRQRGVTLLIALILLVAMTAAGIVLLRSVDLSNIIAGNLAFKQGATHAGDIGIERAFGELRANAAGSFLHTDHANIGYSANGNAAARSPAAGQSWDDYFNTLVAANRVWVLSDAESDFANTGNRVSLVIDRMCTNAGDPSAGANCTGSTVASVASGSGEEAGEVAIKAPSAIYYRITARVDGPRNTRSYVQAMVTL